MKKDKKWLKNEILGLSIKARHKENNQREWHMGHEMALFDVNKLIDQLDEPEITKEQVGKYLHERNFVAVDAMMIYQTGMQNKVIVEKPVIPQFVADWIDTHNLYGNNPLREYRDLESDFNEGWTDEKDAAVYHWVNKNPYAFIDALRYGYSPSLRAASINIGKAIQEGIDMVNQPSHYKGKHGLEILFEHFATKVEELEE